MNTEIPANPAVRELGVAYYDAECVFCTRAVTRWGARFARRGFRWQPLQTPGTPADIADAVVYLLAAPYVTGTTLFVDGGAHLDGNLYGG